MRYLDKLSEAKKRFYTKDEVDAYARGRKKATIARRKKEFEDFKDEVIKKSKEEKKKKGEETNEARKPSTKNILDRREKARKYRAAMLARIKAGLDTEPAKQTGRIPGPKPGEKKLKAEAYIQLGDVLAEAMSDKAKRVVKKLKTSAEKSYRSAEVGEASGESAESVKKKSAKAHKRMAKAQEIEGKG